jgi:8-oxo-dGTP pyrophosphatase MutT (NUDIX family)
MMGMTDFSVVPVDRLVVGHSPWEWPFAHARRREIEAHFAGLKRARPALWNGRVLMLRDFVVDGRVFRGRFFETDFASLLAWRDWDFPDPMVKNSFAMGALRGSDGGFILGQMGAHTANAGKLYFPAGTPDLDDVKGGSVDLLGSITREVEEETGLTPADFKLEPGWFTVLAGPRIAHMKLLHASAPADELRKRILRFLTTQKQPELSSIHIVREPADITEAMPPFMGAFLRHVWRRGEDR